MNISPRMKLILTALGLFALLMVAAGVLIVPQFQKIGQLEADIASADDDLAQAQNLLAARQEAKSRAAVTNTALLQLAAAVPENADLPSLLIELQDKAYENDVQIRSVQPDAPVEGDGFVAIPFTFTVWGSWGDTVDFMQQIPDVGRQVRIVAARVSLPGEDQVDTDAIEPLGAYTVQTEIVIETYVVPAGSVPTSAPAAPGQASQSGDSL